MRRQSFVTGVGFIIVRFKKMKHRRPHYHHRTSIKGKKFQVNPGIPKPKKRLMYTPFASVEKKKKWVNVYDVNNRLPSRLEKSGKELRQIKKNYPKSEQMIYQDNEWVLLR